ncbi:MAG: NosD domain-containing protein [Halobacteriales archaeon]
MRHLSSNLLVILCVFLVLTSGAFIVDVSEGQRPDPVPFDETIDMGATAATTIESSAAGYVFPRAQVFYSQYRYVVGYYGITTLVDDLHRPGHRRQFGDPMTIYVTDYSDTEFELTTEDYPTIRNRPDTHTGWVTAEDAYFVINSQARTPSGPAVIAFSQRTDAVAFTTTYGGTIERWSTVRQMSFDSSAASRQRHRDTIRTQHRWANRTVQNVSGLIERPVAVEVRKDVPTLAAAINRAPPNTTIVLPPGQYQGDITIDKPLTIVGAGDSTLIRGNGTTSVFTIHSDRVAIKNLSLTGVGNTTIAENVSVNRSDWDYRVQIGYGYGDAGVELAGSNRSFITDVEIRTPANGIVVRNTRNTVIQRVTTQGAANWADGFMGVMIMDSRVVVQDSHFMGGRDGVYLHLGDRSVIRNNRMESMRFGVHEMYTSDVLVAGNTARDTNIGMVVMTRPLGNLLVENTVTESQAGIVAAGQQSYVARNLLVDNGIGIGIGTHQSIYEHNIVVGNTVGLRASTLLPTNRVTTNDVVANGEYVSATLGPLRPWTGNYWAGAPGDDGDGDGRLDRPFVPSGPVDRLVDDTVGGLTLAYSPAVIGSRSLRNAIPGLRTTGIIDTRPRVSPVNPDTLNRLNMSVDDRQLRGDLPDG